MPRALPTYIGGLGLDNHKVVTLGKTGLAQNPPPRPSPGSPPTTPSPSPSQLLGLLMPDPGAIPEVFPGVGAGGLVGARPWRQPTLGPRKAKAGRGRAAPQEQLPGCWGQSCGKASPQHHRPCSHPRLSSGHSQQKGHFVSPRGAERTKTGRLASACSGVSRARSRAPTQLQGGRRVSRSQEGSAPSSASRAHPRGSS